MKINLKFSTSHHQESVGSIERNHRFFNQYLRTYMNDLTEWEEYLKYFTFCYNISPHSSFNEKYSPYQIVFNRSPNLPHIITNGVEPIYDIEDFVKEAKYRLQKTHAQTQQFLVKNKEKNKSLYDKRMKTKELNINDKIFNSSEPYDKRKNVNEGPYIVREIKNENIVIEDPNTKKQKEVHKNRIRF